MTFFTRIKDKFQNYTEKGKCQIQNGSMYGSKCIQGTKSPHEVNQHV